MPTILAVLQIFCQKVFQFLAGARLFRYQAYLRKASILVSETDSPVISSKRSMRSSRCLMGMICPARWLSRSCISWVVILSSLLPLNGTFLLSPRIDSLSMHYRSILDPLSGDLLHFSSFSAGKKPTSSRPLNHETQNLRHARLYRRISRLYILMRNCFNDV